ncbi:uncharacterized protein [Diabrotica undecimpunctata]|uniref:uncharacterized protein n=1 Tax=Diabrotica undecimpunctata TaxID=50387 RepID=UPI003B63B7A9
MITITKRLSRISEEFGLLINSGKTKIMTVDRANNNLLHIHQVANFEVVDRFVYLGSVITNTGDCSSEIKRRLTMDRTATAKLIKIWKGRTITKNTKLILENAIIFPITTYAAETWILKKIDRSKIKAFEM